MLKLQSHIRYLKILYKDSLYANLMFISVPITRE